MLKILKNKPLQEIAVLKNLLLSTVTDLGSDFI